MSVLLIHFDQILFEKFTRFDLENMFAEQLQKSLRRCQRNLHHPSVRPVQNVAQRKSSHPITHRTVQLIRLGSTRRRPHWLLVPSLSYHRHWLPPNKWQPWQRLPRSLRKNHRRVPMSRQWFSRNQPPLPSRRRPRKQHDHRIARPNKMNRTCCLRGI